jgi:hypothetical protein
MTDIRTQIPECPLEYEVPPIPGNHTALVITVNADDIDWQEKMLPWTLASLINNTDIVMQGVHLYINCAYGTENRIKTALKRFDLPKKTFDVLIRNKSPFITFGEFGYTYDAVCLFDMQYWAFRGESGSGNPEIKLPLGHVLKHNYGWGVADYSLHPANSVHVKADWIPTKHLRLRIDPDTTTAQKKLANYFMDAGERARWLHDANRAVYGEDYQKKEKNVAGYFFNENGEPNWHLDASILQYHVKEILGHTEEWFKEWRHLGTDALLALYLLKTGQHAYNFKDSLMIESVLLYNQIADDTKPYLPRYPHICNMKHANANGFRHAIKHLMGAQLAISV